MEGLLTDAAIGWDPEIRGILTVVVGVGVLIGSVYFVLATNTGARLGLLLALGALFGWMTIMGVVWWIYGIGLIGAAPSWQVEEINFGDLSIAATEEARQLPNPDELPDSRDILAQDPDLAEEFAAQAEEEQAESEEADEGASEGGDDNQPADVPSLSELIAADPSIAGQLELGGWELLSPSDPQRGEAQATADEVLGPDGQGIFEATGEYVVLDAYSIGGKDERDGDSIVDRITNKIGNALALRHPPHFAVVQVQQVVEQETAPGEPPPTPVADETEPVISIVMIRDLGDKRFPPAMVTVIFGVLFAIVCNTLHRRDKLASEARARTGA